jgi:pyridoxine 5-phosphate synthase
MIRLGVNIDHVATVRQARRARFPELVAAAHAVVLGGAEQVTLHLREDRRHVQDRDVETIREAIEVEMNLEMAATDEMVAFARRVRPDCVCIVPEKREELTTEGGLAIDKSRTAISKAVDALKADSIPVSLFVDPDERALLAANEVGADVVEIHTGRYADARGEAARLREFLAVRKAAASAKDLGLRVHAGHGLDYRNVGRIAAIPEVEELNIGFAIVARALFVGLPEAVREMRHAMLRGRELGEEFA